jgi:hypothetical protein
MLGRAIKREQLVSTGIKRLKPTDTNWYDNDYLYSQLSDLVNPQYKAWYCKQFYRIGKAKVLELASVARNDGKQPAKLFSILLKRN